MLCGCLLACPKTLPPLSPNPPPIVEPKPVCALSELPPTLADPQPVDLAGPDQGCPDTFEICLTRKSAKWLLNLKAWSETVTVRCQPSAVTVGTATAL